ncbi:hypothetical protein KAURM247S_02335 [Kitasatospora aureofaciens]
MKPLHERSGGLPLDAADLRDVEAFLALADGQPAEDALAGDGDVLAVEGDLPVCGPSLRSCAPPGAEAGIWHSGKPRLRSFGGVPRTPLARVRIVRYSLNVPIETEGIRSTPPPPPPRPESPTAPSPPGAAAASSPPPRSPAGGSSMTASFAARIAIGTMKRTVRKETGPVKSPAATWTAASTPTTSKTSPCGSSTRPSSGRPPHDRPLRVDGRRPVRSGRPGRVDRQPRRRRQPDSQNASADSAPSGSPAPPTPTSSSSTTAPASAASGADTAKPSDDSSGRPRPEPHDKGPATRRGPRRRGGQRCDQSSESADLRRGTRTTRFSGSLPGAIFATHSRVKPVSFAI